MAAPSSTTPKIIFGTGNWGSADSALAAVTTREQAEPFIEILKKHNVTTIDTSRAYPVGAPGTCEALLSQLNTPDHFTIDTKVFSDAGDHKSSRVIESVNGSLQTLGTNKVGIEYLHWPDRTVPLIEPLRGINEAYKEGKFERFGISNYSVSEVEEILQICEKEGYVKPSVYQGQYNALCRRGEAHLFPLLRKNNIAFYAYSPTAGGAFNTSSTRLARQDMIGTLTRSWYGDNKTALATEAAQKYNMTGHELALRWVLHHSVIDSSLGDAVILGASKPTQLEESLRICEKGPLPDELVKTMDDVWAAAEAGAPSYSPWVDIEGKPLVLDFSSKEN